MSTLGFEVQWFDNVAGLMKTLFLKFFIEDGTLEVIQDKSVFLKRIHIPDIHIDDFYIGASITVFNRLFTITRFANLATERYLRDREIRLCCSTSKLTSVGDIIDYAETSGFKLGRVKPTAVKFRSPYGVVINEGDTVFEFIGGVGSNESKFFEKTQLLTEKPSIVRLSFALVTETLSLCQPIDTPIYSTLCLVKPHILKDKMCGKVLRAIKDAGFSVMGLYAVHMTPQIAEELFDVYSNIYSASYSKVIQSMCSGTCLAVIITGSVDIVSEFRAFTGPPIPELAKVLRPDSLRARFGNSEVANGVHCTDLPSDGEMECRFFFETLADL